MTPELRAAQRAKLAADVAAWIAKNGEPEVMPPGVSGDTYVARMNAHGRAQKIECEAKREAARRRGAKTRTMRGVSENNSVQNPR